MAFWWKEKKQKTSDQFGFFYPDNAARRREFRLAKAYFKATPGDVKVSRELWAKLHPDDPPQHSFLKRSDGRLLAIAHGPGKELGKGSSGRVKYAMDSDGRRYALKIESTNEVSQQEEGEILKEFGILHGEKVQRHRDSPKSTSKKKNFTVHSPV